MARQLAKLSPKKVATVTTAGRHSDGGGLYLVVDASGAKRWSFLFRWRRPGDRGPGRLREMGLGSLNAVSIEKARKKAAAARELLSDGKDPIEARKSDRPVPTFATMADELIATRAGHIESDKSMARLRRALDVYAQPLRCLPVDTIQTDHVLATLMAPPADDPGGEPLWIRIPASAKMARSYIEAVLDAAKARGFRSGENPARWRGHLDHLLSKPKKLTRGHHAAMAFDDVPAFVQALQPVGKSATLALEFLILTAARSGEVLGARWSEIDLVSYIWTVPPERMKARREHRVPLSPRTVEILETVNTLRRADDFIFPGAKAGRPLSGMAFDMLLRRRKLDVTTHGFRSAFRDWVGDATTFQREVAEAALAHTVGDSAERAYRRGDALQKRRELMEAWGEFCCRDETNVLALPKRA
jgi:integrase